jgi:hypothetical protein
MEVTSNQIIGLFTVGFAAAAWIRYAQHPTARNLRRAIINTLAL